MHWATGAPGEFDVRVAGGARRRDIGDVRGGAPRVAQYKMHVLYEYLAASGEV